MKQIVKLRIKKLADGQGSYYLDWYRNGKRYYEYLKLYVDLIHTDKATREANKDVERAALNLRNKKEDAILSDATEGLIKTKSQKSVSVLSYIRNYRCKNIGASTASQFSKVFAEGTPFSTFTDKDVQKFHEHLTSVLSGNTIYTYMACLKSALKAGIADNLVSPSVLNNFPKCRLAIHPVTYLTIDELRSLKELQKGWGNNDDKRAFLFACYTGLRFSDIRKLTWGEVRKDNRLMFSQLKTQIDETGNAYAYTLLPLNMTAVSLLGERRADDQLVFPRLSSAVNINTKLKKIQTYAGITKNLHFHIARHTYGVMLINNGVDIYTVSKLLGHSNISTTAKYYANLTDENALIAASKVPEL